MIRKLVYAYQSLTEMVDKSSKRYHRKKAEVLIDILYCALRYSASPANYYYFGFPNLNSRQRKTYVTHSLSEKLQAKYNDERYCKIFYDKFIFSKVFAEFFGEDRKIIGTYNMTLAQFTMFIKENDQFIYKPLDGGQGKGIKVFERVEISKAENVYHSVKSLGRGVIESWIKQHKEMDQLYPNAVNPIRIQTIYDGKRCHCLCGTITVGYQGKIANASQHSIFALIDVKTGKIATDACDYDGNIFAFHPETKVRFQGYQIPYWNKVLQMLEKVVTYVPQIGYVGWDIAITDKGPILIEGNNDPGYVGYQLAELCEKHGNKKLYQQFL